MTQTTNHFECAVCMYHSEQRANFTLVRNAAWKPELNCSQCAHGRPQVEDSRSLAFLLYTPPFVYKHGFIWDASNHMVADYEGQDVALRIRGWGRIQYKPNAEQMQDAVGGLIAEALTEFWNCRMPSESSITETPSDTDIRDTTNTINRLRDALTFCRDIAAEELVFARVGTGSEVALRHIARRGDEALEKE